MEDLKKRIKNLLKVKEDLFLFTSCGEEAICQVIFGVYQKHTRTQGKHHFLTTTLEEAVTLKSLQQLETFGCYSTMLPVNVWGQLTTEVLEHSLTPRTVLLTLSWVPELIYSLQPIKELIDVCKRNQILIHIEGSLALKHLPFVLAELDYDFFSFDGYKTVQKKGIGGLLIKNKGSLPPLIFGGEEQEGLRGGFFDERLCLNFIEALEDLFSYKNQSFIEQTLRQERFETLFNDSKISAEFLVKNPLKLPGHMHIAFPGIHSEVMHHFLDYKVKTSRGGGSVQKLSSLLEALGIEKKLAQSALYVPLDSFPEAEWPAFLVHLEMVLKKLGKVKFI